MAQTKSYYDLRDALKESGCPMCRARRAALERYMDGLIYEKVNDAGVRKAVRQSRGFCERHAWDLVRHGAALGVAILTRDVVRELLSIMRSGHFKGPGSWSVTRLREAVDSRQPRSATAELVAALGPQGPCPACKHEAEIDHALASSFVENLHGPEGLLEAYRQSDGFCLPHVRQVLARVPDEATYAAILEVQLAHWSQLEAELSELVRKSDYRFADEEVGDEGTSWLRAIASLAGESFQQKRHRVQQRSSRPPKDD